MVRRPLVRSHSRAEFRQLQGWQTAASDRVSTARASAHIIRAKLVIFLEQARGQEGQ